MILVFERIQKKNIIVSWFPMTKVLGQKKKKEKDQRLEVLKQESFSNHLEVISSNNL